MPETFSTNRKSYLVLPCVINPFPQGLPFLPVFFSSGSFAKENNVISLLNSLTPSTFWAYVVARTFYASLVASPLSLTFWVHFSPH